MSDSLSKEDFGAVAAQALIASGVDKASVFFDLDAYKLVIKDGRGEPLVSIGLYSWYQKYKTLPQLKDRIIEQIVDSKNAIDLPESFEAAKEHLRPVVRSRWYLSDDQFPYHQVGEHLGVFLGIDMPETTVYVDKDILKGWGCSFQDAFDHAFEQMGTSTEFEFETYKSAVDQDDVCHFYSNPDGYGASRVIFSGVMSSLAVKGETLVVVPSKGYVMVTGTDCDFGLEHTLNAVIQLSQKPDNLAPHLMLLKNGHYYSCQLSNEHKLYSGFKRLELEYTDRLYYTQSEQMHASYEGVIGMHSILNFSWNTNAIHPYSMCTVAEENLPASIPETDYVIFASNQIPQAIVSLDRAVQILQQKIHAVPLYPRRFEISEYPDENELEAMGFAQLPD